jgi:Peptidase_C39 like family
MPDNLLVPLYRQQSEGDCLPVCVQMVLDYWGQPADRDDLIAQLGADPDVGTPGSRVLQLHLRGLSVTYRPVTELELQQWIAQRIPVDLTGRYRAVTLLVTSHRPRRRASGSGRFHRLRERSRFRYRSAYYSPRRSAAGFGRCG